MHSPMRHCYPFERCLGRRRQLGGVLIRGAGATPGWRYGGWGHCIGGGRRLRSGHDVGASRNAGGESRGSCPEMNLPIDRTLVVLLLHDQGGQDAEDGHGDRQKD